MSKKGNIGFNKIILWAIGIITVIILIIGPRNILEAATVVAFSAGIAHLPGEEAPEFQGQSVPTELQDYYDKIHSQIKEGMKENPPKCLEIGKPPEDWGKFRIVFSANRIRMVKEDDKDAASYDPKTIAGFVPCVYYCKSKTNCYTITQDYINKGSQVFYHMVRDSNGKFCIYILEKYNGIFDGDWIAPIYNANCK
jgi:hypothetical protein